MSALFWLTFVVAY